MVGILGANSVSDSGYEISNSLRSNFEVDNAYLSRTGNSNTGRQKFTYSVWVKRSVLGSDQNFFHGYNSANYFDAMYFTSGDTFFIYGYGGGQRINIATTRKFRDTSAWFHILVQFDTTQGTASNRVKIYVNGVQETSLGSPAYPSQNLQLYWNSVNAQRIGRYPNDNRDNMGGYFAEMHNIDDAVIEPTEFGEFNDNGVWIPKAYEGSYGTDGFYLEFKQTGTSQNSSGIGADTSGNDNHFAVTNFTATDVTTDTPTNNFATMNPLYLRTSGVPVFSEGNTFSDQSSSNTLQFSTILVTQGKWYMEVKVVAVGGLAAVGISDPSIYDNGNPDTKIISYRNNGEKKNLGTASSYGNTFTTGDIIGIAFNADDGEIFFYKNGTAENSGTAAFTGIDTSSGYVIGSIGYSGEASNNYGNPSYTISSGNADANGYGNFEYAVPSGYYSLCTKNLAEFG